MQKGGGKRCVLVADDHTVLRDSLRRFLIAIRPDCHVAEASDFLEAISMMAHTKPHLVISDLDMPGMNPFDAIRDMRRQSPNGRILIHSLHAPETHARLCIEAGADAYVCKGQEWTLFESTLRDLLPPISPS
jgi:DNA-binding NarL/FixJ family response regulator